jgi:hypothetical protein
VGLRLDKAAYLITLTAWFDVGVFVMGEPLKVAGSVVQWLIVDVIDVIAAPTPSTLAWALRKKSVSHQAVNLYASHFAFTR